jgi:hypothetical protein
MKSKETDILNQARKLAEQSDSWADLSNAMFAPSDGLVARTFPSRAERNAFRKTKVWEAMHDLVRAKMERTGLVEGAEPQKSGRFVVRLPKSMHAALEREAAAEGTSLNQLVLAKLAVQLSRATSANKRRSTPAFRRGTRHAFRKSG